MIEIWKDIPGFIGYQVSDLGNVRTHNKITYTNKHKIRHWKDKILKKKISKKLNGRQDYRVDLWKDGKPYTLLVSRLVAFTFYNEDINNKTLTVNHIDGNTLNNKLNNLEIMGLKENIQHGFRTGLYNFSTKIKIVDKITGTIIYPSSLSEGSKLINQNHGYLSKKIKNNEIENNRYIWEKI